MPEAGAEMEAVIPVLQVLLPRFISRTAIETEIIGHPDLYPRLSGMSGTSRKTYITSFMKARYPLWGNSTSRKKACYVWIVEAADE